MAHSSAKRKLAALDADGLAVISAHVQEATVNVSDIVWRQHEKRLVVGMRRLDWDQALDSVPRARRLISALRFDRVLSCKARNIDMAARQAELDLVGIEFDESDPPGGSAVLLFSDGGALRLDVECLECELADLGPDLGFSLGSDFGPDDLLPGDLVPDAPGMGDPDDRPKPASGLPGRGPKRA